MAVIGATHDQFLKEWTNHGSDPSKIRGDLCCPKTLLIPREQVARQRQCEHQHEQRETEPEVDFTGSLVSAINDYLHEMQCQEDGHGMGGEVVQAAQQPTAAHLVLD